MVPAPMDRLTAATQPVCRTARARQMIRIRRDAAAVTVHLHGRRGASHPAPRSSMDQLIDGPSWTENQTESEDALFDLNKYSIT
jgi:hypothetical protein